MRYDLILKGGQLLDPAAGLEARRDVAFASGRVAAVDADIPREVARETVDVGGAYVAPGLIEDTEMGRVSKALMGGAYLATIPLGHLGTVQDVIEAVLFLASARARYITGETLNVNGGSHMA